MRRREEPAEPCCVCGDPEGRLTPNGVVIRCAMARFGVEGLACHRCYARLYARELTTASTRTALVRPCARCGEPEGWYRYTLAGQREPHPVRMTFDPAEGPICGECARAEFEESGCQIP